MRYAIVIEKGPENYSAYVPDLPGCVSTGSTVSEAEENIKEAISFHIDGLKEDSLPVPEPSTICEYIETTWKVYYQAGRFPREIMEQLAGVDLFDSIADYQAFFIIKLYI